MYDHSKDTLSPILSRKCRLSTDCQKIGWESHSPPFVFEAKGQTAFRNHLQSPETRNSRLDKLTFFVYIPEQQNTDTRRQPIMNKSDLI
jgi:hypothetical protein